MRIAKEVQLPEAEMLRVTPLLEQLTRSAKYPLSLHDVLGRIRTFREQDIFGIWPNLL